MDAPEFILDHPAGVRVSRSLTESDLLRSLPSVASTKRDMKTGWVWYRLPSFMDDDREIASSLGFNQGALKMIDFAVIDPKIGKDWNDWSAEMERLRAQSIEQWLKSKGFTPGSYPWGAVWAGCDPKTGDAGGCVRYVA